MNKIVEALIKNNIEKFVQDYKNTSRQVFLDENGTLIHPGEFGVYREKIVKELLQRFLPAWLAIGTGFIVTSDNERSTQCDLIIYDKNITPVIENSEQRFFPIECVAGVIEVKSKLNKTELKTALIKLAEIKRLREHITSSVYHHVQHTDHTVFNSKSYIYDQIATFLICEEIDMNIEKGMSSFFQDVYKDIDKSLYHNVILSLDDGAFLYHDLQNKMFTYFAYYHYDGPVHAHSFIYPCEDGYNREHIMTFLNFFSNTISSISILFADITNYLGGQRKFNLIDA